LKNMTRVSGCVAGLAFATGALCIAIGCGTTLAQSHPMPLASHLAIYDLKLAQSKGRQSLEAVRGRIVFDFSGSACAGYDLKFRQVTELDNGEGKQAVSDLRSTTWEDGEARSFRFSSQNYLNDQLVDGVEGVADRTPDDVMVKLTKPEPKRFGAGVVSFPTEQMRKIIAAARADQTLLDLGVYDGSENGQKVYQSLTVIGKTIMPDERKPADAAARQPALALMKRWPVTISYFEKGGHGGEQTPVYTISFELYENGISRALVLDYGEFAVRGEMTSLELRESPACP
jgi:EipB-like